MRVFVPATTANVGSGFDCVGIALGWYDELHLEVGGTGVRVEVTGEGAEQVPLDERHLVIASIRRGLEEWGDGRLPGLRLRSHNTIPHSRGLGSSAAAIVAGLAFAWGIARGPRLDLAELARLSSVLEGHADNAAAAVYGGATLGWVQDGTVLIDRIPVADELTARVWVPETEVPTKGARATLPEVVPRADAVRQAACAARLMVALANPERLLAATEDQLHQRYRRHLMAESFDLMTRLREVGVPATISGAGPTTIAIGTEQQLAPANSVSAEGFREVRLSFGCGVRLD